MQPSLESQEVVAMSMMTIRNLDPEVKRKLQQRAARHGQSMEAEAREILADAVSRDEPEETFGEALSRIFADIDPIDIPVFERDHSMPRVVDFG